jgi:hypothetical protein
MTSLAKTGFTNHIVPMVLLFALTATPAKSQPPPIGIWIDIHVNGPWDYVPYKASASGSDQIALIIPKTPGHDRPVFLVGPHADQDADLLKDIPITTATLHTVIIDGLQTTNCPGHPTSTSTPFRKLPPITKQRIDSVIDGTATGPDGTRLVRYAIVLPKPCYTTSMAIGDSYSKMDVKEVDTTNPQPYTSWMVLHYFVSPVPFTATYDKVPFTFIGENGGSPAVGFVMRADKQKNDPDCDGKSLMSVISSAVLWDITGGIFAQFPQLKADGSQSAAYSSNPKCRSSYYTATPAKMPMEDKAPGSLKIVSVGSGDCHRGQFVINSALP